MSVADKITRLTDARDDIRTALNNKGVNASEHGFEDFAGDIGNILSELLTNLDTITFGNNSTVPEQGKTVSANYEAIAQAIDTVAARNNNAVVLDNLTIDEGGTYNAPSGIAYNLINANIYHGIVLETLDDDNDDWVRPSNWPDLDSIELDDDFEGLYLTYDLTKTENYGWIGIYVKTNNSTNFLLERGHLENNIFIADESFDTSSNTYFRRNLDSTYGNVLLWKLTVPNGHIVTFGFITNSTILTQNYLNGLQPCVERRGKLPYFTGINSNPRATNATTLCYSTLWLESDDVELSQKSRLSTLYGLWWDSYNLLRLKISNLNTSNWQITSLYGTWYNCYKLKALNLSTWDTSNWAVTTMYLTWANCYNLKTLNITTWNTINWKVNLLTSTWIGCASLTSLNLSNWNTNNWVIKDMFATWRNCYSLINLDISTWNTNNWAVEKLESTWDTCVSLLKLNISNWNTSNWTVINFNSTWRNCYSLLVLNINDWDVSNWSVKDLSSTWMEMRNLKILNLTKWNTSNWAVTTLAATWANCYSLQILNISTWDTSNWAVTNMQQTWGLCYCLKSLDLSNWDTSNWIISSIYICWNNCISLEDLKIERWNTSKWTLNATSNNGVWNNCNSLKVINLSNWDATNWEIKSNGSNTFDYCYSLTTLYLPPTLTVRGKTGFDFGNTYNLENYSGFDIDQNINLSNALKLTRQSLLNVINKLPIVTSTKTLTLRTNKLKLTAEEIAVATEKGWTIA